MRLAVKELLTETKRYTLVIRRWSLDPGSWQPQEPNVVLHEGDPLVLDSHLDPRLIQSRRVVIFLTEHDNGTAVIDLTRRNIDVLAETPGLRDRILAFDRRLRGGARFWWIRPSIAWLTALAPLWISLVLYMVASYADDKMKASIAHNKPSEQTYIPAWLDHTLSRLTTVWPLFIAVAIGIRLIVFSSGGLRIWPEFLTTRSLVGSLYKIRTSGSIPRNIGSIVVSVIAGCLIALFTVWIKR